MAFSYIVSYGPTNIGPWTQFGVPVAASPDVVTGLSPGTSYFFQVITFDPVTGLQSTPVVAGPVATSNLTTITGITLTNAAFVGTSPSGTQVGTVAVQTSGGLFSGTLSLSGTNAASFQIVGNALRTNGILAAGTYNIIITATMAGAIGSPFAQAEVITGTSAPSVGPVASGSFINIDFGAVTNRTVLSELFGVSSARMGDNRFSIAPSLAFQNAMRVLNPQLLRIDPGALGPTGLRLFPDTFRNGINSPDWTGWDAFITSAHTFYDISPARLVVGVDWTDTTITTADFASICSQTAIHLKNTIGGDGSPVECKVWEIWPESVMPVATYNAYFNAAADALHAVDATYIVIGPAALAIDIATHVPSLITASNATRLNGLGFHDYLYNASTDTVPSDTGLATQVRVINDLNSMTTADTATFASGLPILMGRWNIEASGALSESRAQDTRGAYFMAAWLMKAFQAASQPLWGAVREAFSDTVYGMIGGSSHAGGFGIDQQGYLIGQVGSVMPGAEVSATVVNSAQNLFAWATKSGASIALMLINYGTTTYSGQVALSRWPINANGTSTIHRWEISAANTQGVTSTLTVTVGLTAALTVPGQSVVILTP